MNKFDPRVTGPATKYVGAYRLGRLPNRLAPHNLKSWKIIESMLLAHEIADFWDLSAAVRRHEHGAKGVKTPQGFVRYCITRKWLRRAS